MFPPKAEAAPLQVTPMSETVISSFILRFTQETDTDTPWRGVVRHVQSEEESRFTRIEEALRFIGRFVDVGGDTTTNGEQRMLSSVAGRDVALARWMGED
jgi:hypothetical protein